MNIFVTANNRDIESQFHSIVQSNFAKSFLSIHSAEERGGQGGH